jgi:hypothetical protein
MDEGLDLWEGTTITVKEKHELSMRPSEYAGELWCGNFEQLELCENILKGYLPQNFIN